MDNTQSDIDFIMTDLLPEMVYNRCFCDLNSREFVEFDSASINRHQSVSKNKTRELYKAQVVVKFSGEPKTFFIIIKLHSSDLSSDDVSFGRFLNEEMFYNKMTNKYKINIHPKCYVADMGKYGRPVVVLEDLETLGYHRLHDYKLDEDHLSLLLKAIANFHGRGMSIKRNEFNAFREFYAKLVTQSSNDDYIKDINKAFNDLKDNLSTDLAKNWSNKIGKLSLISNDQDNNFITICHGCFNEEHWFFKYDENNKPIDLKILGWNEMKYTNVIVDLEFIFIQKLTDNPSVIKIIEKYFSSLDIESYEQLYREFLLTYFYPNKILNVKSREIEIELINLLNKLA